MAKGIIGYSGFVGSNLARQIDFDKLYNSKNIDEIRGESFEELYCAGAPGAKWLANKHPEEDGRNIQKLLTNLAQVTVDRFVLISTVDVYRVPDLVDESSSIKTEALEPYGKNRRKIEQFVESRFPVFNIVRLPGLFGKGLKKNMIYDFIHLNEIEKIHSEAEYQFYNLDRLTSDVEIAIKNELRIVNFATEPVKVKEVVAYAFDSEFKSEPYSRPARYDMRTKYAHLYGSKTPYMIWKNQVLEEIKAFVQSERRSAENESGNI
jgi:nucleoside-diphosphate-sugar epimerase